MTQYELAVLYHPDLEVDLSKAEEKVTKIVTGNGGAVVGTDNWGKRRLAYKIKGQEHGIYVFYTLEMPGEVVNKVEATLNITDEVIRFLITKIDHKEIAKAETLKAEKAAKAAARGDNTHDDDEEEEEEEK